MSDTTRTDSQGAVQLRLVSHINETLPPHPAPLKSTGVKTITLVNAVPDDVDDRSLVSDYAARVPRNSSVTLGSTIVQLATGFDIDHGDDRIAPSGLLPAHKNRLTSSEDLTVEDAEVAMDLKLFRPEPHGGSAAIIPSSATSTRIVSFFYTRIQNYVYLISISDDARHCFHCRTTFVRSRGFRRCDACQPISLSTRHKFLFALCISTA